MINLLGIGESLLSMHVFALLMYIILTFSDGATKTFILVPNIEKACAA